VTAYHDLDSPQTMRADAAAAGARLPATIVPLDGADLYAAYPTDLPKPEIEVSEAARRLADAIYG
jgi:hypothetical protein